MKKTITIIIIVFTLLLGGIGYYVYLNSGNQTVSSGGIFDGVKNFFPFGKPNQETSSTPINSTPTQQNTNQQPIKIDRMFEISTAPVAGYVPIDRPSTSTQLFFNKEKNATTSTSTKQIDTFVRFVERATGHVLEAKIPTIVIAQLSNTTIPKVYESFLNSSGTEFITRTLNRESIVTDDQKIGTGTSATTSAFSAMYPFNTDIFLSSGDRVFYTVKNSSGSVGYLTTFNNKKPTQVFSTPLRDIGAQWSGGDIVSIYTKPHSEYAGLLFSVDTKKKTTKQTISDILGLTSNPSFDGKNALYNSNIEDLSLAVLNISSLTETDLGIKTLPEKCVWSKKNINILYCAVPGYVEKLGYPEKWYQGLVSFNDDFWSVNVATGEQKLLYRPSDDRKQSPDATNLSLNDKESYLFFINKNDLSFWGLSL